MYAWTRTHIYIYLYSLYIHHESVAGRTRFSSQNKYLLPLRKTLYIHLYEGFFSVYRTLYYDRRFSMTELLDSSLVTTFNGDQTFSKNSLERYIGQRSAEMLRTFLRLQNF